MYISSLLRIIKERLIAVSMVLVLALIILSAALTWYNKKTIIETTKVKNQAELVKTRMGYIFREHLRGMDLGLRGYALTKNKQVLSPYESAVSGNASNLRALDSLFRKQKLDTALAKFEVIKKAINGYVDATKQMKAAVENDDLPLFVNLLNQDKGYTLWRLFAPFNNGILKYEDNIIVTAQAEYESAIDRNIVIQMILLFLSIPSIVFIIYSLTKQASNRRQLFKDLENNNRQYLFDSGTTSTALSLQSTIDQSTDNFKKAASFIKEITSGNFNAGWEGMNAENIALNDQTLAGELLRMRDKMKKARAEDDQRFWTNSGLTQFSQLIRTHEANLPQLCDEATRFIARYLKSQQGALYILNEAEASDQYLELLGQFAAESIVIKRIEIGDGLIGQAFLNGEPVVLAKIPEGFLKISSSLGEASPKGVCIIPLKYNDKIEGVFEFASLEAYEPYHIEFLQRAGEFLASAIGSAKVSTRISRILQETQQQSGELRSQEEELRQNMEELTATQEEMERQKFELNGMFETAVAIMNELPEKIFLKDKDGVMVLANENVAKAHGLSVAELVGKSDFDFVDSQTAHEWRQQELDIMKKGKETYTFDETLLGQTRTLTTVKMSFYIPHLKQTGLLGIQTDITEIETLKKNKTN